MVLLDVSEKGSSSPGIGLPAQNKSFLSGTSPAWNKTHENRQGRRGRRKGRRKGLVQRERESLYPPLSERKQQPGVSEQRRPRPLSPPRHPRAKHCGKAA